MYKNELPNWAVSFFTSVEVNSKGELAVVNPDFDIHGSITHLRFILEDHDVSRIPPGCKLPHEHYRNTAIHKSRKDRFYSVFEKAHRDDVYVEYYVREENGIYYGGYVAKPKVNTEDIFSWDQAIFEYQDKNDGAFYRSLVKHLQENGVNESMLEKAKNNWRRQSESISELLAKLK